MFFAEETTAPVAKQKTPECILVSNRGPIEYHLAANGGYEIRQGAGGVVTGLLGAIQQRPVIWISLTMTEGDRHVARHNKTVLQAPSIASATLRFVEVSQEIYSRYYDHISNQLLWFIQHYLFEANRSGEFHHQTAIDWQKGYVKVNDVVAQAVIEEVHKWDTKIPVILQDYHLYLVAERVRAAVPEVCLSQIIYIPWPDVRYWAMLPDYMVRDIYQSMAANDIVGFQTLNDARNFLTGAEYFLNDAQVVWEKNSSPGLIMWRGRVVRVCVYPIALSAGYLRSLIEAADVEGALTPLPSQILTNKDQQIILREDRMEPTKNILRGFQAYDRLLQHHPEMRGHIIFLALFVPSRQSLGMYRSYERRVQKIVDDINKRYGNSQWQPIVVLTGNHRLRGLLCLQFYDVLLVNSLVDGMNLVVKEGGLLNQRSGVIVLSRTAGAHEILGEHVLTIAPTDIDATADALYRALIMTPEERLHQARRVRETLLEESGTAWLDQQLHDLHTMCDFYHNNGI